MNYVTLKNTYFNNELNNHHPKPAKAADLTMEPLKTGQRFSRKAVISAVAAVVTVALAVITGYCLYQKYTYIDQRAGECKDRLAKLVDEFKTKKESVRPLSDSNHSIYQGCHGRPLHMPSISHLLDDNKPEQAEIQKTYQQIDEWIEVYQPKYRFDCQFERKPVIENPNSDRLIMNAFFC